MYSYFSAIFPMFFISSFIADFCISEVFLWHRAEMKTNRTVKIEY